MNIETVMLVTLGFLMASLITLLLAPAFWKRAVRLTTERVRASMPVTVDEMQADKDQLRADFAVKIRQFEIQLEHNKLKTARQLIELSRKDTEIAKVQSKLNNVTTELEEQKNSNQVMRQTILTRIPQMEAQLQKAKEMLGERYQEITKLKSTISRREGQLGEAKNAEQLRQAEMQRLKSTLDTTKYNANADGAQKVRIEELENLKERNRVLNEEAERLREKLKESNAKMEVDNTQLKNEMHKLAERIIEMSSKDKNGIGDKNAPTNIHAIETVEDTAQQTPEKENLANRLRGLQGANN